MKAGFLVLLLLVDKSCQSVRFETPQPEGVRNEKSVPKKMQGTFYEVSKDKSKSEQEEYLNIKSDLILKHTKDVEVIALSTFKETDRREMDSIRRLAGQDSVYRFSESKGKDTVTVRFMGDSISVKTTDVDTLYSPSPHQLLRKYKGEYYISTQQTKLWHVVRIRVKGDSLFVRTDSSDDAEKLRQIMGIKNDSITTFRPDRKQWGTFIKGGGFRSTKKYVRDPTANRQRKGSK
ncbi:MAG: hypothetical protein JNL40_07175 [Cyclobacteriaceae bacterium]|nr:hypothetical protein [Cyclobacteriaceae bacterium]